MPNRVDPGDWTAIVKLGAASFIDCANDIAVSFQGTNEWTFEGWFKFDGLCPDSTLLSKSGEFVFGTSGRKIYAQRSNQIGRLISDDVLEPEKWIHLAVTFDGLTMSLYADGIGAGWANLHDVGVAPTASHFLIGEGFQGEIDSFRIWNSCVPQLQLVQHMWQDYPTSSMASLLRQYDFSAIPPTDTSRNNRPPVLRSGATQFTAVPAVHLANAAFCDPYDDDGVNPGGGGTDAYTILSWIHVDDLNGQNCIFSNGPVDGQAGVVLYIDKGVVKVQRGGSSGTLLSSTSTLRKGSWYSVACTFDGTKQTIVINGEADASGAAGQVGSLQAGQPRIGSAFVTTDDTPVMPFQGYIQSVTVWNTALTPQQIASWMHEDPSQAEGVVANYWFGLTPVQNMTSAKPVGLVNGASFVVLRESVSSSFLDNVTTHPNRPGKSSPSARVSSLQAARPGPGISSSVALSDAPDFFSEEYKSHLIGEVARAVPSSYRSAQRRAVIESYRQQLDELEDAAKNRPQELPWRTAWAEQDGTHSLILYHQGVETEVFRSEAPLDACTQWEIKIICDIVFGLLFVLLGTTSIFDRIATFVGLRVIAEAQLIQEVRGLFAAGINGRLIITFFSLLYAFGLLSPMAQYVVQGLSWLDLLLLVGNIAMLFVPTASARLLWILSQLATAVYTVYQDWQDPANCWKTGPTEPVQEMTPALAGDGNPRKRSSRNDS